MVPYQSLPQLAAWAMADTALTHPNMLCQQVSGLYVMALGHVLENDCSADELYQLIKDWASQLKVDKRIIRTIDQALFMPPTEAEMSRYTCAWCVFKTLSGSCCMPRIIWMACWIL